MKNYLFLSYGYVTPTQEIMDAWSNWFESIGDKVVDSSKGLGPGREFTHTGIKELSREKGAATGYLIFTAENIDAAENIAKSCPIITSNRVYEIMSM